MHAGHYSERIDLRHYIIPVILILATFLITSVLTINGIQAFYYRILDEQSIQYAQSYASRIAKSARAMEIINELLEDKLITASQTVALYEGELTNEILANLARSLGLEELYYYNLDGEIIAANLGQYLGWTSYPGHPVEIFRKSEEQILVEDIRADSESGNLYKYSYIKTPHGFFQLGIGAQRVDILLEAFVPSTLLQELADTAQVDTICFLDNDFIVQDSSNPSMVGFDFSYPAVRDALRANETYSMRNELLGKNVHQVFTPVYLDGTKVGVLAVTQSLKATQKVIRQTTILSIVAISIVFASLIYALLITYQKRKQLVYMAYHHSGSELPNRRCLQEALQDNSIPNTALLLIHFRDFTEINHLYGFHFGDQLIRTLANHLQEEFGQDYQVFHFSGNRLAIYVAHSLSTKELARLANQIVKLTAKPIADLGLQGQLDVRIAIVEIPDPDSDPEKVFTNASLALMHHPTSSQSHYSFFSSHMEEILLRTDTIERELRNCLEQPDSAVLWVEYQPIIDLRTSQIVSFEALTRMRSPQLGVIAPPEFIAIAERKQLIIPLGNWVLASACQFLSKLQDEGFGDVRICVNVSGIELLHKDFPERVRQLVDRYGVYPQMLELEITESIMINSFSEINAIFQQLRALGVKIAIDDFGTGYSSFSRIEDLSVDNIKIDKHFIDKIISKSHDKLIIKELVAMCHKLGLKVVAEGVETEKQRQYLFEQQCDMMQGFLFSKSLTQNQALDKLRLHSQSTG